MKIIYTLLLFLFLFSTATVSAKNTGSDVFKYDNASGWYWYTENPDTNKTEKKKVKMTPLEALKLEKETKTTKLLQKMIDEQRVASSINIKILAKLEEAFPRATPKMYIDSEGKPCVANSSAGCFIMPVVKEAQNVPVIKDWIRNPSPKNSKKYLKWMARYMTQVKNISRGSKFAFLKGGSDVYGAKTDYAYGDDLFFSGSEKARAAREGKIIASLKGKLGLIMFMGQNEKYEKLLKSYDRFYQYPGTFVEDLSTVIVFPSKKAESKFKLYAQTNLTKKKNPQAFRFISGAKFSVRPDLFKKYNVRLTPSISAFYSTGEEGKEKLAQVISIGKNSVTAIRRSLMNFLTYNGIINEKELSADKSWATSEDVTNKDLVDMPEFSKPTNFELEQEKIKLNTEKKNEK